MDLTAREAARAFDVAESTLLYWVKEEGLPAFLINGRYRFNRVDLLEWANHHRRPLKTPLDPGAEKLGRFALLRRALGAGGVHHAVAGGDAASALAAAADRLPLPAPDRALAGQALSEREKLGSTALGDGIAIPHPRSPLVFPVESPIVTLCFLKTPVDFHAADGLPVSALFLILAPSVRSHLALLADLAAALHDDGFKAAVSRGAPAEELLASLPGAP
ncbi:MAG: PTS sugar transporter subunit IIA [Elusimicrobia bacterium]|nr:PTS sugar transporter subunit IIA [Elusimicrobiota bacterium]